MRLLIFVGVLLASILTNVSSSFATEGPWCLRAESYSYNCSMPSFEMCHQTALPLGGTCYPNPSYHAPAPAARSKKRTR